MLQVVGLVILRHECGPDFQGKGGGATEEGCLVRVGSMKITGKGS